MVIIVILSNFKIKEYGRPLMIITISNNAAKENEHAKFGRKLNNG
ncbi:MAG TPA: hypothetical protein VFD60_00300 [Nitrososphaeraceae archaeon]|jgi:hypothetical protein|nr:hypothetical protein [Nitrososphaeraceae archaeon]